jgi:hypothetical protein
MDKGLWALNSALGCELVSGPLFVSMKKRRERSRLEEEGRAKIGRRWKVGRELGREER